MKNLLVSMMVFAGVCFFVGCDLDQIDCNTNADCPVAHTICVRGVCERGDRHDVGTCDSESSCHDQDASWGDEICDDGVDNSGNGLSDCDDPACASAPACAENPGTCDDEIPCSDPSCATDPACETEPKVCDTDIPCSDARCTDDPACEAPTPVCGEDLPCSDPACADEPACALVEDETCDDGIDNDGDGNVDCDDEDCTGDPACGVLTEVCNDGIDNDEDGLTDCDDPDCADEPACDPSVVFDELLESVRGCTHPMMSLETDEAGDYYINFLYTVHVEGVSGECLMPDGSRWTVVVCAREMVRRNMSGSNGITFATLMFAWLVLNSPSSELLTDDFCVAIEEIWVGAGGSRFE